MVTAMVMVRRTKTMRKKMQEEDTKFQNRMNEIVKEQREEDGE